MVVAMVVEVAVEFRPDDIPAEQNKKGPEGPFFI